MAISEELKEELKDAMRSRDRGRLDVIRQIETEVARRKAEPGFEGEVSDDTYLEVIGTYVKRMQKAKEEFGSAGDRAADMIAKLDFEIDYLGRWLPQTAGEDETRALVRAAISELGVDDPKMTGRVIGHIMKSGRDDLDGGLVNRLVREELAEG